MEVHLTNQHFLSQLMAFFNKFLIFVMTRSAFDGPLSVKRE